MRQSGCSSSVAANRSHRLAWARAPTSIATKCFFGNFSARYRTIATDSVSTWSPSTSTGSFPAGLILRKLGSRCSPAMRLTVTASKSTPNSCKVHRTRIDRVGANSNSFMASSVAALGPHVSESHTTPLALRHVTFASMVAANRRPGFGGALGLHRILKADRESAHAATETERRMLRQGPAGERDRCQDLQL